MKERYELDKLKRRPGKTKTDTAATKVDVSVRLDAADLVLLKDEAARLGLSYQTLLRSVVHQYVTGELVQKTTVEILKKLGDNSSS